MLKRYFLLPLSLVFFSVTVQAQNWQNFDFQNGDLLFQDIDCGALCDAIETVTPSVNNKHFSHVGIVYKSADSVYIIEAMGKDVHLTSLSVFLNRQLDNRGNPKVVVGRLKEAYRRLNSLALGYALQQRGIPYDEEFIYDNGKYYCSELVYDAYKFANNGRAFFNLYPMTFKDPATDKTFGAWKDYYEKRSMKIPEGKPGCNPGSIALSANVAIVASFY